MVFTIRVLPFFNNTGFVTMTVLSYSTKCSTSSLDGILPSKSFSSKYLKKNAQRALFTSIVAEVQLFLEMFGLTSLPRLNDGNWNTLLTLRSPIERSSYLLELCKHIRRKPDFEGKAKYEISKLNQMRHDRGEMVYAPYFHTLFDLQGKPFRQQIDRMFGAHLISQMNVDEQLPRLLVDCRFMRDFTVAIQSTFARQIQQLADDNWTSRIPYHITIANFVPDSSLSEITKRLWHFRYGPEGDPLHTPHPFAPDITSRSLLNATKLQSDEIIYISPRATTFLPPSPPNCKAVILCASSDYQPWSSSLSAAMKDGIRSFRIPLERHVVLAGARRRLKLHQSANILRSYFSGNGMADAINACFQPNQSNSQVSPPHKILIKEYVQKISHLQEMNSGSNMALDVKKTANSRQKR